MATIVEEFFQNDTWVCPAGVTSVKVECWGGGGNGGTRSTTGSGGGGGGGAYAKKNALTVSPGTSYTVNVGSAGGDSWFSTSATVLAKGGASVANNTTTGGAGGAAASCIGDVVQSGGAGVAAATNAGGGGEAGGPSGDGNAGSGAAGGTGHSDAGDGGAGSSVNGNAGGAAPQRGGGNGFQGGVNAESAKFIGGAGGGAKRSSGTVAGGAGSPGMVRLTFTYTSSPYITSISEAAVGNSTVDPIVKPTDTQDGDVLILLVNVTGNPSVTPPTGFTQIFGGGLGAYYKIASSEPSSYSMTMSGSSFGMVTMLNVRGADTTTPIGASASASGTGTTANPGTITPLANSLLLFFVGVPQGNANFSSYGITTSNPTFLEILDMFDGNGDASAGIAWGNRAAATATTAGSATLSSSQSWGAIILALSPKPSGPANVKTWDGIAQSTGIKTYNGVAVGSTKGVISIT